MRTLPAKHTLSMPDVDRALVIATLGLFAALALRAIADPQVAASATVPVAPPVGFVQIAISPHSDALVSIPFRPADASLDAVLAGQLTATTNLATTSDRVLIWDAQGSRYRTAAKLILPGSTSTDGQWFAVETSASGVESIAGPVGNDFRITPGVGFVLCNRQEYEQIVRLGGEVVLESIMSLSLPQGLTILGTPFTSAKDVNETKWSGPGKILSTNMLTMGAGSWVSSRQPDTFTEPRPYTNPFATNNLSVFISDLLIDPDKVTLDIRISDSSVKSVDVLILDLAPTSVVTDFATGWKLAAANLDTTGKTEIHWSDDLASSASSFRGVRLYLVTRADPAADLNGDGIPDPRNQFTRQTVTAPATVAQQPSGLVLTDTGSVVPGTTSAAGTLGEPTTAPASARSLGIVYVSIKSGSDLYSGLQDTVSANDGPKKTIREGAKTADLKAKDTGSSTMVIRDGVYNEDLRISGKPVHVRIQGKVTLRDTPKKDDAP